jgi:hypothetical protein
MEFRLHGGGSYDDGQKLDTVMMPSSAQAFTAFYIKLKVGTAAGMIPNLHIR